MFQKKSNIKNVAEEHFSFYSYNTVTSIVCCQRVPSTFSQIAMQIEVIQQVVLAKVLA